MGENESPKSAVSIDTRMEFREDTMVPEHFAELRSKIQKRFRTAFESLPPFRNTWNPFSMHKYIRENPRSVIFVPEKDFNMFQVVLDEAKDFASSYKAKGKVEKRLKEISEHEFEHVQKSYELGVNVNGVGLVMMKFRSKPIFGGFVTSPKGEEVSLRDNLRIYLAPKLRGPGNAGDLLTSELEVLKAVAKSRSLGGMVQVFDDFFFVISERFLPKKVHNFFQENSKDKE